ncbi:dipeptide ABC transporter ATP-binding protein [Streptomyces sp. NPDC001714]|uniref:dipeptide ABC transporter ATP-binding protein n=1 Tax=Streptomyces sp. NPDC001714 TaxID=3364603 RepID=UPI00367B3314
MHDRDATLGKRPPDGTRTLARPGGALLSVTGLRVAFPGPAGPVEAVRGVSIDVAADECLAVVGESGSGKSVTARALVGLAGPHADVRADSFTVAGEDATAFRAADWRRIRGRHVGLVVQDALTSLDPLRRVGAEIAEPLRTHRLDSSPARIHALLDAVHMPEPDVRARQYPFQLSGGLRQRALIASALAAEPGLLIADEPTTALDVTVQARVLDLLGDLKRAGTGILLISHDLAVVARLADRIAVMYAGRIVEEGPAAQVLGAPRHPYTRELLAAVPATHTRGTLLAATVVRPAGDREQRGCPYAHRCVLAADRCRTEAPRSVTVGAGHRARCLRTDAGWQPPARTGARRTSTPGDVILEADGVGKSFRGPDHELRPAVRSVSFTLRRAETLGLVGESGSGKSTVAQMVLGLLEPDHGTVRLRGRPWSGVREAVRRPDRHRVQFVPQDPLSAFDPRYTVERVVGEALGASGRWSARRNRDRIGELLHLVGLDTALLQRRPAQLSGGQRQRVAIARALAPEPDVLICDEPVSALDVSVQAQILDLLTGLREGMGLSCLFISHDLGVIHHVSDRVLVMRAGEIVEHGPVERVYGTPEHPYTRELLSALPTPEDGLAG